MDMELDLSTTTLNSQVHPDDTDDEDETRMELVPEVTLVTQPSSPASNSDSDVASDDVDVERVDDVESVSENNNSLLETTTNAHNSRISRERMDNENNSTRDTIYNDN